VTIDGVSLDDGTCVDLDLVRFEILAPDAEVVVADDQGQRPMERPDVVLLRGRVVGEPGSRVFVGVSRLGTHGFVQRPGGELQLLSTGPFAGAAPIGPGLAPIATAASRVAGAGAPADPCSTARDRIDLHPLGEPPQGGGAEPDGVPPCRRVQVAVDSDWEFTSTLFGGDTAASCAYAVTLFAAVSEIYQDDVNTELSISFMRVWGTSADPWTATDTSTALVEFRDYWRTNETGVTRDVAHLLSAKNLGGGIAYVGVVCNTYWAFGVSGNLDGSFPYPLQDYSWSNWDVVVVAHELGHNFGTGHTHDYVPPIDGCGTGDCSSPHGGTIMSYCHTCSGGLSNIQLNFHPTVVTTILGFLDGLSCDLTVPCSGPASWVGPPGGSWFTGSNWSTGSVPGAGTVVTIDGDAVIDAVGALAASVTVSANASLDLSVAAATLTTSTVTVASGGVLSGVGVISGDVTSTGAVRPGAPIGRLDVTGDYTQAFGGALDIYVDGYTAGTEHDTIAVGGTATLDGTLRITTGPSLVPDLQYVVHMTAGGVSGTFATYEIPELAGAYSFMPLTGAGSATLQTLAVTTCNPSATDQWASTVVDYSSQWSPTIFSAARALGPPDVATYGNSSNAWAPTSQDGTLEHLTLGFDTPVYATGVTVRETFGNGFVTRIDVVDMQDQLQTVWTGTDPSAPGAVVGFRLTWPQTGYLVKAVRVYVDTDATADWEEIDAVQLHGVPNGAWADSVIGFSSEWSPTIFSAAMTLGAPDVFHYRNDPLAWAPSSQDGTLEHLTLGFSSPVYATGVTVRETFGNGFVYRVDVVDLSDQLHTVWTGADSSSAGAPAELTCEWPRTSYLVKGVRVHVDTDATTEWEEIDAVMLHGQSTALADCDGDGIADACEIASGRSADVDADGIPDECDLAPIIDDVTASVDPVAQGQSMTLTATGVDDVDADVSQVSFYRDADDDGALDVGSDALLGTDSSATGGWTWTGATGGFPLGAVRVFARAEDGAGLKSAAAARVITVDAAHADGLYIGAPGGSWFTGSGWGAGTAPDSGTSVVITSSVVIDAAGAQAASVTIQSGGLLTIAAGGTLTVSGSVTVEPGGALAGAGAITGAVVNDGVVRPGDPIGTLTVTGTYTQTITGSLEIDVDGYTASTEHDVLAASGAATLDGAVTFALGGSFAATEDTASFLTAASISGAFATWTLPDPGASYSFVLDTLATGVDLITVSVDDCSIGTFRQWATSVIDFSSEWSPTSFGAARTLGPPGVLTYGNHPDAWGASVQNGSLEYITVGFDVPTYATGVVVRETYGNGFVYQVDVVDMDDALQTVWTGTDPSTPGTVADFLVEWSQTAYLVKGVRIHVDTDATAIWEEIDAVQLHGVPGETTAWASHVIDFSSQWDPGPYGAVQTLDAPDVPAYGNDPRAWAAGQRDGSTEYVTLGFPAPMFATGVTVRETWGNGFVYQVDVVDLADQLHTVWTGTDPSAPGAPADFQLAWTQTTFPVQGVRVYVDTDATTDWEEIDAVRLHGLPAPTGEWASHVIDFTSQWAGTIFSAGQAVGEPDVPTYGNDARAWAASSRDGTLEYVTLGVFTPLYSTGVLVRETYGAGFVYQVDLVDTDDVLHTIWTGTDPSPEGSLAHFQLTWPETAYLVKGVRVHIDTDATTTWEELDAVRLDGRAALGADCNGNGIDDACDIAAGTSADVDVDGRPDECGPALFWGGDDPHQWGRRGPADDFVGTDAARGVDAIVEVLTSWGACPSAGAECPGDRNGDGVVDADDLAAIVRGEG
jgi:hypothetical protein